MTKQHADVGGPAHAIRIGNRKKKAPIYILDLVQHQYLSRLLYLLGVPPYLSRHLKQLTGF